MKQIVTQGDFRDAFRSMDRADQFTYEGLGLLYDAFLELEDTMGEEIELDVIAICCEYNEDTAEEIAENYDIDADSVEDYLEENTHFIGYIQNRDTYVYQAF